MASDAQAHHRTYLLCTLCKKTQWSLSVHLRRKCMKNVAEIDIARAVDTAKTEANNLLRHGRLWDYDLIKRIVSCPTPVDRLIEELQVRGNVVLDIPPNPDPTPAVPTPEVTTAADPGDAASVTASTSSSGELYQCPANVNQGTSLRERMSVSGLYKKHSNDHPLLCAFATYLRKELGNENCKQEVDNVARFLFYMDHREPNLLFVRKAERTRQYLADLAGAGLSMQTVQNYIKSIKRFLNFHVAFTDMMFTDKELHGDCKNFILFLGHVQASNQKQVSKEVTRKRFEILSEGCVPLEKCVAVLETAKADFLNAMGMLTAPVPKELSPKESQLVLYYLEALLILRHLQRPGVVEHMTVKEWMLRTRVSAHGGHVVVGVKEHKTAATQVATFALSQEEEMWFDTYFTEVRPLFLCKKRKHMDGPDEETFFISSTGNPIHSASNDLARLHDKYNLEKVTSQMTRRSFESATKLLTDSDKSIVEDYLTHSMATTERRYRMKLPENVVSASLVLQRLAGGSESESRSGRSQLDDQTAYNLLVRAHPVTVDGVPPKRSERTALTQVHERYCYDRWRSEQLQMRIQHVLEHFGRRQPSEASVRRWLGKQGWKVNIPNATQILQQWKPAGQVDTALDSARIQKMTRTQKWKGLVVLETPGKGRGVFTSRRFCQGEVVCDYHGKVVSRQEGLHIRKNTGELDSGYMFFFTDKSGQAKCMDAHEETCPCHPERATFGRLINHSSKKANIRPRLYHVGGKDVVIFLALRDIAVNEELLFDYGVQRKSFAGEGLDLMWL